MVSRGTPSPLASHRLDRFYGDVSESQNEAIMQLIPPGVESVLDVGCGVGNFTYALRARGYTAVGLDLDHGVLNLSQKRYGAPLLVCGDVYRLPFCDEAFEYAVLRESAHHFTLDRVLAELRRIVRGGLLIFDPNPTGIVRLARKIIAHDDGEASSEKVIAHLRKHGFTVRSVRFRDVMAFPLSGGFVGP